MSSKNYRCFFNNPPLGGYFNYFPLLVSQDLIMAILAGISSNQAFAYSSLTKVITATIKRPNTQDTEMFALAILET